MLPISVMPFSKPVFVACEIIAYQHAVQELRKLRAWSVESRFCRIQQITGHTFNPWRKALNDGLGQTYNSESSRSPDLQI